MPLPEIFAYYLQSGRVDVGFLGAAQIDRFGNLNSTVIGPYETPSTRLPGAGGAPEIASNAKQTFVVMKASTRSFVKQLDFRTSGGYLGGNGERARSGARGGGPAGRHDGFRHPEAACPAAKSWRSRPLSPMFPSIRRAPPSAGRSPLRYLAGHCAAHAE